MRRDLFFISSALFLICLAVFSPVFQADFIHWDDDLNITGNAHIQQLNKENLRWMFTDFSFMRRYVPMSWLTWGITAHFFGVTPRAFHLEGLILHSLNAVLVFLLLKKLMDLTTRQPAERNNSTIAAALGALIWAVHPLRVEVVAWANCQMYAQSLLFLILSLFAYFRAVKEESTNFKWILLSTSLFLLSLLTYPTGIAFVAVLLVLDVFVLRRLPTDLRQWPGKPFRHVLIEKVPFIIATMAVAGVTLWARAHLSEFWKVSDRISEFGWDSRLAQAFYLWAYYIWKPLFSFTWSPVYTQLVSFRATDWPFLLSALAVITISIWLWMKRARLPWALALWICHLVLLLPMLGLTEHPHYPNDRYNYIAAIVWSLLLALAYRRLISQRLFLIGFISIAGIFFGVLSFQQTRIWGNSTTLFEATLQRLGNDPYCADIYWRLGNTFASENNLPKAISSFQKALEIAPSSAPVHVSLAEAFLAATETNNAIAEYQSAVSCNTNHPLAHFNLGVLLEQQGRVEDSIGHFRKAIEINPRNIDAYNSLSRALAKSGRMADAIIYLEKVLELDPANPTANFNLGNALMQQNKLPEALGHFERAVKGKRDFADAHYQLGTCLAMTGRVRDALPEFLEATRLNPNFAPFFVALGMASAQTGQFAGAVSAYREALRINPDTPQALINLGWILSSHSDSTLRNGPEALTIAQHAVALTQEKDVESLDLLAAAYAECERFSEAAATVGKAIAIAQNKGPQARAAQLEARLELYRTQRPLRQ